MTLKNVCLEWLQYLGILFQYNKWFTKYLLWKGDTESDEDEHNSLWHAGTNALVEKFSMINLEIILIEQLFPMRKVGSQGFLNIRW